MRCDAAERRVRCAPQWTARHLTGVGLLVPHLLLLSILTATAAKSDVPRPPGTCRASDTLPCHWQPAPGRQDRASGDSAAISAATSSPARPQLQRPGSLSPRPAAHNQWRHSAVNLREQRRGIAVALLADDEPGAVSRAPRPIAVGKPSYVNSPNLPRAAQRCFAQPRGDIVPPPPHRYTVLT